MKSVLTVSSIAAAFCLGAAAATQPDALDGLAFWVRADTGVTTNASGNVTEWADQSSRDRPPLTTPQRSEPCNG